MSFRNDRSCKVLLIISPIDLARKYDIKLFNSNLRFHLLFFANL